MSLPCFEPGTRAAGRVEGVNSRQTGQGTGPGSRRGRRTLSLLGSLALLAGSAQALAEETLDPQAAKPAAAEQKVEGQAKGQTQKVEPKAAAKPPAPAAATTSAAPAVAPGSEDALQRELRGKDEQALEAVRKLGALDTPRSTEILLGELSLGLSPKVTTAVLDVLLKRRAAESLPLLSLYAHHRSPELRKRAVQGLAALLLPPPAAAPQANSAAPSKDKGAKAKPAAPAAPVLTAAQQAEVVPQLIAALSDASADVREVAAEALGTRREKAAEPALIQLLQRKDAAAPAALGQIGGAETARSLAEMIGSVPDRLLAETLGLLLIRPDFGPDPLRLEVVKTLGKLSGSQPIDLLNDYLSATGKDKADKARPSRVEAQKIIEQRTAK